LRLDPLPPAANLTATQDLAGVHLTWTPPPPNIDGVLLYRSESGGGPFTRLSPTAITDTNYTDVTAQPAAYTYMLRTVALQTSPSGSYYNLGEGIFTTTTVPNATVPIQLQITQAADQVLLSWVSQAGTFYHVETVQDVRLDEWQNISGSIQAAAPTCSWSAPMTNSTHAFFRVVSP